MNRNRTFVAFFDDEHDVLSACGEARRRGMPIFDLYSPYALHGADEAMGLKPSRLTWVCFVAGLFGLVSMLGFQYWVSAVAWPLNVGGKPFNSLPAFVPVTFEFTVLCAGLVTVAALFAATKLWPGNQRAVLPRVTNDQFALAIVAGAGFDEAAARALCEQHHAVRLELVGAAGGAR